jgi:hypothetical protein
MRRPRWKGVAASAAGFSVRDGPEVALRYTSGYSRFAALRQGTEIAPQWFS